MFRNQLFHGKNELISLLSTKSKKTLSKGLRPVVSLLWFLVDRFMQLYISQSSIHACVVGVWVCSVKGDSFDLISYLSHSIHNKTKPYS